MPSFFGRLPFLELDGPRIEGKYVGWKHSGEGQEMNGFQFIGEL
jgi:hypothetical protein